MNTRFATLALMLLAAALLSACRGAAESPPPEAAQPEAAAAQTGGGKSASPALPSYWVEHQPQTDSQGAVVVEIRPKNLNNPGNFLEFAVAMNTHSVDLSMNLAQLATLSTDTGAEVQALAWDGPSGGHHVRGILRFPAAVDGQPLLTEDTRQITITLREVDAPERTFVWRR